VRVRKTLGRHRDAIVDDMVSVVRSFVRSFVPPSSSVVRRESMH